MVFLRSFFACAFCSVLTTSVGCGPISQDSRPLGTAGSGGASTRARTERSWPATEVAADLERVFVVPPLPPPPRPPFDRSVCELGEPSTPAHAADSGDDSGADAASSVDDAGATTSFELPELGRPCGDGCPATSCYEPTSGNPICTRPCSTHAECGSTGVCQAIGQPVVKSLCFRRCESNAECLAVNPTDTGPFDPTINPDAGGNRLVCRATKDPRDGILVTCPTAIQTSAIACASRAASHDGYDKTALGLPSAPPFTALCRGAARPGLQRWFSKLGQHGLGSAGHSGLPRRALGGHRGPVWVRARQPRPRCLRAAAFRRA